MSTTRFGSRLKCPIREVTRLAKEFTADTDRDGGGHADADEEDDDDAIEKDIRAAALLSSVNSFE